MILLVVPLLERWGSQLGTRYAAGKISFVLDVVTHTSVVTSVALAVGDDIHHHRLYNAPSHLWADACRMLTV